MAAALSAAAAGDLMLTPAQQSAYNNFPIAPRKNAKRSFTGAFERDCDSDPLALDLHGSGALDGAPMPAPPPFSADTNALLDDLYRELKKDTHSLKFGSDTLIEGLPAKRARKSADPGAGPETGAAALARPMRDHGTISHGYGEFTRGAIETFLDHLRPHVRDGDSFVDIGSGHGRVVLHTAARMGRVFSRVRGIEAVQARHDVAAQTLAKFSDALKVELLCRDATELHLGWDDHLFMYDYVFSERTHKALLPNITRFKTLTTTLNEKKLRKRGLDHGVKLLFKRAYRTTGGTSHTLYTYAPDVELTEVTEDKEKLDEFMRGWHSEPECL